MNNFRLIGTVDVVPMLRCIERNADLWDTNRARTAGNSPHRDASDIILRGNPAGLGGPIADGRNFATVAADITRVDYPAMARFSFVAGLMLTRIWDMARFTEVGSMTIVRLPPGGRIHPHVDYDDPTGPAARHWDRFHVMLKDTHLFTVDDESCGMEPGEVWWVDTTKPHGVIAGENGRTVLIVDLHLETPMPRTPMLPPGMLRAL